MPPIFKAFLITAKNLITCLNSNQSNHNLLFSCVRVCALTEPRELGGWRKIQPLGRAVHKVHWNLQEVGGVLWLDSAPAEAHLYQESAREYHSSHLWYEAVHVEVEL